MRRVTLLVTAVGVALLVARGVALAATFDGTPAADAFAGTPGPDDIRGRGGDDILSGAAEIASMPASVDVGRTYAGYRGPSGRIALEANSSRVKCV